MLVEFEFNMRVCENNKNAFPSSHLPRFFQFILPWEDGVGSKAVKRFKEHLAWRTPSDLPDQPHNLGEVTHSEDEVSCL